nr:SDR family oxidoreductase [uncultured Ralstonia sp.]
MTHPIESFHLYGQTALVTGASSGLGRHFVGLLARCGARVIAAARRTAPLEHLVSELEAKNHSASAITLDVTNAEAVTRAFDQLVDHDQVPDIVINCAGVAVSRPMLEQSEAEWDQVLDTNLKGAWLVSQEAARRLVCAGQSGSIVNIASITGERVAGAVAPYCASKAALIHLTRSMALELARYRIRVNALAPGYVMTELNADFLGSVAGERLKARIPQQRFGQPEDLDGPLLLLASDAGRFMTGSVIAADGGHLVSGL